MIEKNPLVWRRLRAPYEATPDSAAILAVEVAWRHDGVDRRLQVELLLLAGEVAGLDWIGVVGAFRRHGPQVGEVPQCTRPGCRTCCCVVWSTFHRAVSGWRSPGQRLSA